MDPALTVLGVGVPTLDRIYLADAIPAPDSSVLATAASVEGGGQVATALVTASRLGLRVSMVAQVGSDDVAEDIIAGLEAEGVETMHVQRGDGRSSSSLVLVTPDGRRAIVYDPGEPSRLTPTAEALEAIRQADGILLERWDDWTRTALAARPQGVVLLDLDEWLGEVPDLIAECDIVIASEATLRGRPVDVALEALLAQGCEIAVITCGADGSYGKSRGGSMHHQPAFPVEIVDTTGAGDVFHGSFLVAHLEGKTLADSMRFAACTAALQCTSPGGRAGIPTREVLESTLEALR